MKIRLSVGNEKTEEVRQFLTEHGIELDDNSDFILIQKNSAVSRLPVRNLKTGEKIYIQTNDIVYLESFGHNIIIHSTVGEYVTGEPLNQLELMLDRERFVRVSASVLVAHTHIQRISPALSRKYVLYLSDGAIVDVTRGYYAEFKDRFGL